MTDPISLAYTEQVAKMRQALAEQAANEAKNLNYQTDFAKSVASFGSSESNPLNIIRIQVGGLMSAMGAILNPLGDVFNAIKTPFEAAEAFGRAIQDLLSSLIALDHMIMYQIQRVQNYRMSATLRAIHRLCGEIDSFNEKIDEIANAFGGGSNLDSLIDDWEWRFERAYDLMSNAYDENNDFLDDSWLEGLAIMEDVSTGSYRQDEITDKFRQLANAVYSSKEKTAQMSKLFVSLYKYMDDSETLLENIKQGSKLDKMLKRAVKQSVLELKDAKDILGSLKGGCRYDPDNVFNGIGKVLSKADTVIIALGKSRFDDKFEDINVDNINIDSDCILARYSAYLDDLELLSSQRPDSLQMEEVQENYVKAAMAYAVFGTTEAKARMDSAKGGTSGNSNTCDSFANSADGVFNDWNNATSDIGEGALGFLGELSELGGAADGVLDLILGAQAFTLDTYEDFLNMTPVGRMLTLISKCLGVSTDFMSASQLREFTDVRNSLSDMIKSIEGVSKRIADAMNSIFGFLDGIDSAIAEFIAALIGLLKFCEGGVSLEDAGLYGTSASEQASQQVTSGIYSNNLDPANDGTEDLQTDEGLGGCLN